MEDFLFSIEIIKAEILEDYRKYLPGTNKPSIHWGVDYRLQYMREDIPEQPGMLSRRFMEITLKPRIQPSPEIIARELVMRGSKSVSAASQKAREKWWIEKPRTIAKELSIEEEVVLIKQLSSVKQNSQLATRKKTAKSRKGKEKQSVEKDITLPIKEKPKRKDKKETGRNKAKGRIMSGQQTPLPAYGL